MSTLFIYLLASYGVRSLRNNRRYGQQIADHFNDFVSEREREEPYAATQ